MNIIEKTYKWNGKLSNRKSTNRIILHHAESKSCTADDIHRWHLANGWCGIGYHFFVRKDGSIYRGRPEGVVGSHAKGSNSDSIGICFEGSYMTETMNQTQINAGRELVAYLKNKYGISKVQKHMDVCSTNCPGTNFPFDAIVNGTVATAPTPTPAAKPATSEQATGTYEVTASDLSVRTGPGTGYRRKRHDELTKDGQKHDKDKDGCLEKGTHVTVYEWKNGWARTPSGWLCGDYLTKV
ncbi:peptidoglycan recognition protein family protein [Faecalibacillus intestinalis]|uniref:peptidoglycan recognition protein family protein n=1 Tax=Faecalibacillus intestinalis TaxID=1982626 RepID=UPI000E3FE1BE|nr:peptidoglycan recognition family protein [Faecalibacillus intestinalis]RGF27404.1 N-acetylmuramoyl-L-alanine amidase [Coprobacillus sp. AM09-26]